MGRSLVAELMESLFGVGVPPLRLDAKAGAAGDLTRFAGVVMTPRRRSTVLRHVEFLRLADKRILLILVTPEGDVQNRILFTDRAYSPSELIEAVAGEPLSGSWKLKVSDQAARDVGKLNRWKLAIRR